MVVANTRVALLTKRVNFKTHDHYTILIALGENCRHRELGRKALAESIGSMVMESLSKNVVRIKVDSVQLVVAVNHLPPMIIVVVLEIKQLIVVCDTK